MNILITGARAPISVDMIKVLVKAGHQVWAADSVQFPIGRFVPGVQGYVRLASPRHEYRAFASQLVDACSRLGIEKVIPTSEEVFWLAHVDLPAGCLRQLPDADVLEELHNKWRFAHLAAQLGYGADRNILFRTRDALNTFLANEENDEYVLKPVFSRFASQVVLHPTPQNTKHIAPNTEQPWMAQSRARGTEICVYNIAQRGELLFHVAYQPVFRAGAGAGIYFEPVRNEALRVMSARFVEATAATGQLSFDVIDTAAGLVAIECNPRGTSGAHLAAQDPEAFAAALLGVEHIVSTVDLRPMMLSLPMLAYHAVRLLEPQVRSAWRKATDPLSVAAVPRWAQCLATTELLARSIWTGKGALAASTHDIEWNGERIPRLEQPATA